ncbi:MAG: hypothetical protein QG635_104 [Bacteroidota bacterium]|nr:hypothetical protein [Bacteroidota bacterium]
MKRYILIIISLYISIAYTANAASDSTKTDEQTDSASKYKHPYFMLVTNPISYIDLSSKWNLSAFLKISSVSALGAGVLAPSKEGITGFGYFVEYRYYPLGSALHKFYLAPSLGYIELTSHKDSGSAFLYGFCVGWSVFLFDVVNFGVGIGFEYQSVVSLVTSDVNFKYGGTIPIIRVEFGLGI